MSSQIAILPLTLTYLLPIPCFASQDPHKLTCLPSSPSLEVPSDGELKVQCNVTVPEDQVRFLSIENILISIPQNLGWVPAAL